MRLADPAPSWLARQRRCGGGVACSAAQPSRGEAEAEVRPPPPLPLLIEPPPGVLYAGARRRAGGGSGGVGDTLSPACGCRGLEPGCDATGTPPSLTRLSTAARANCEPNPLLTQPLFAEGRAVGAHPGPGSAPDVAPLLVTGVAGDMPTGEIPALGYPIGDGNAADGDGPLPDEGILADPSPPPADRRSPSGTCTCTWGRGRPCCPDLCCCPWPCEPAPKGSGVPGETAVGGAGELGFGELRWLLGDFRMDFCV